MTTSSISHRLAPYAAAALGLAGILLTTAPNSAHAVPVGGDGGTVPGQVVHTRSHYIARACFITPPTWNEALDGPLPRCYTYLP